MVAAYSVPPDIRRDSALVLQGDSFNDPTAGEAE